MHGSTRNGLGPATTFDIVTVTRDRYGVRCALIATEHTDAGNLLERFTKMERLDSLFTHYLLTRFSYDSFGAEGIQREMFWM